MNLLSDFYKNHDLNLRTVLLFFTNHDLDIFAYTICGILVVKMSHPLSIQRTPIITT